MLHVINFEDFQLSYNREACCSVSATQSASVRHRGTSNQKKGLMDTWGARHKAWKIDDYSALMSHGSKNHRAPGSIGSGTTLSQVFPRKLMAGQLGAKQITVS